MPDQCFLIGLKPDATAAPNSLLLPFLMQPYLPDLYFGPCDAFEDLDEEFHLLMSELQEEVFNHLFPIDLYIFHLDEHAHLASIEKVIVTNSLLLEIDVAGSNYCATLLQSFVQDNHNFNVQDFLNYFESDSIEEQQEHLITPITNLLAEVANTLKSQQIEHFEQLLIDKVKPQIITLFPMLDFKTLEMLYFNLQKRFECPLLLQPPPFPVHIAGEPYTFDLDALFESFRTSIINRLEVNELPDPLYLSPLTKQKVTLDQIKLGYGADAQALLNEATFKQIIEEELIIINYQISTSKTKNNNSFGLFNKHFQSIIDIEQGEKYKNMYGF